MTRPLSRSDLQRAADFAVIRATCDRYMVTAGGELLTLSQVAEFCSRVFASRKVRNLREDRDRAIAIAVEWDLDADGLSDQSDACIHELAELAREGQLLDSRS